MGHNVQRAGLLQRHFTRGLRDLDDVAVGKRSGDKAAGRIRNKDLRCRIAVVPDQQLIETVRVWVARRAFTGHGNLFTRGIGRRQAGHLGRLPVHNHDGRTATVGSATGVGHD